MIDFLSDGPTLRGLLAVLSIGADRLAAERGAAHGEALESAVLAALECLVTALDADVEAVARLREDAAGSAVDSSQARRIFFNWEKRRGYRKDGYLRWNAGTSYKGRRELPQTT